MRSLVVSSRPRQSEMEWRVTNYSRLCRSISCVVRSIDHTDSSIALRKQKSPRFAKVNVNKVDIFLRNRINSTCMLFLTCLVDTCRWFPGSVPRWPWVAASSLWHIVKLFRYWGMSGSGKRSHMDQTIRLRSSHVGVSRCLRLIRYSFEKCVQCLLEWFGWTVGHISQFWWQGIKEHGASYSETSISYRLNCWWGLMTNYSLYWQRVYVHSVTAAQSELNEVRSWHTHIQSYIHTNKINHVTFLNSYIYVYIVALTIISMKHLYWH